MTPETLEAVARAIDQDAFEANIQPAAKWYKYRQKRRDKALAWT